LNDSISLISDSIENTFSLQHKIELYKKALDIAIRESDTNKIASTYNALGANYDAIGSFDIAIEYYISALELYKKTGSRNGVSNSLNNLGVVYSKTGQNKKALEYFRATLSVKMDLSRASPNDRQLKYLIGCSYNNIGLIHNILGQYDSALTYFDKAGELRKSINDSLGTTLILNNIGLVHFKLGKYDEALRYFIRANHFADSISYAYGILESLYNLSETYLKTGEISKAEHLLAECEKYAEKLGSKNIMMRIYELYSKVYIKKGDHKQAYDCFKKYSEIKESIQSENIKNKIANLQITHEVSQKEEKIKMLTQEKNFETEKSKLRDILFVCLFLVFLLVLLLAIIFFLQKKKLSTANIELLKRNLELISAEGIIANIRKVEINQKKKKYQKSALSDEKKTEIINKIKHLLFEEKIYLHSNITIIGLAEKVMASRTYVSQIINESFDDNFTNMINKYRIKHARKMLSGEENNVYSIEGIAKSSGFTSISSFNTLFKKHTGLTPSMFRKLALEK
jgi:tetratricopeptide (TPR) repeat protein